MERESHRASASVAPAILPPPAPLAPTASVASVIPPASVPPPAPLASVIPPRTNSTTVISDDDTTVSQSPITISDDEEEEIAPVRRLPAVRPRQSLVDPQYGGDADEETPISTTPQAESGQVSSRKRTGYHTM